MSHRKQRDNQELCARRVRELARYETNKRCFECGQPGVTYTDVTVGCFVCTSCSGMLRGLNPPHRVKSISMTTFSLQEVEFLQNHGNEVGRRTWLCAFDPKTDGCFDTRDIQRLKEFLQDKYEKKKWHFSKNQSWRESEGPFSPSQGHTPAPTARPTRTLSQSQLSSWERAASVPPEDLDAFAARPSRSQSFRDPSIRDSGFCGIERQRPVSSASGKGSQCHTPTFPALPRPSASSTFRSSFTLGRSTSSSGASVPFKAIPKSLSLDCGGLAQHTGPTAPVPQDRYAALSQLDSVFSESSTAGTAPPGGPSHTGTLFGSRLSSSSTPASSPGLTEPTSSPLTFPCGSGLSNPFNSSAVSQPVLSTSNPFCCVLQGDCAPAVSAQSVSSHSAFAPRPATEQEANGFTSLPAEPPVQPPRPVSVNPFTGTVYPSRSSSRNPFI